MCLLNVRSSRIHFTQHLGEMLVQYPTFGFRYEKRSAVFLDRRERQERILAVE